MGLTTKEIGSSSFNDMISSVDRRSEYVENRANANVTLNNFLTPYTLDNKSSILNAPCGYSNGTYASLRPVQTFGPELVTNGDFDTDSDWQKSSTATISNGSAHIVSDGSYQYILQVSVLTVGKKYKVEYEIVENNLGGLKSSSSFGANFSPIASTVGFHSFEAIALSSDFYIERYSACDIKIDNVSIKEITDADFDFTRGSSATRVNEQGLIEDVQILSGNLVQNGDFEQIGSELVTNGNFDTDSDWIPEIPYVTLSISNGIANVFSTQAFRGVYQPAGITAGKIYKATITYKSNDDIRIYVGGSSFSLLNSSTDFTTETSYIKASGNSNIYVLPTQPNQTIEIDNVSVKEVGQNWTFVGTASISDGKATINSPSGELAEIYQSSVLTLGKKYKLECTLDKTSGDTQFVNGGTFILNNGSNTIEFTATDTRVYFKRGAGSVISSIDNISVIEITDDTDIPRIDYTSGQGALLLEPQRTNLTLYSQEIDNGYWGKTNGTVTPNQAVSPDGSLNSDMFAENTTTSVHLTSRNNISISSSTSYTLSVFAKSNGRDTFRLFKDDGVGSFAFFNLQNGTIGSKSNITGSKIEYFGNDWYRCSITFTSTSTSVYVQFLLAQNGETTSYLGDGASGFYIYGFQLEAGSYPTSYIKTEGSTVTRAADVCYNTGSSDLINSTEGVFYLETKPITDNYQNNGVNFSSQINLSDGNLNNGVNIRFRGTTLQCLYYNVSSYQAVLTYSDISVSETYKVAFLYKQNDFKMYVNGVLIASDTNGSIGSFTLDRVTFDNSNGVNPFYGKVKSLAVFKEALTDEELAQITSATQQEVFYQMRDRMNIKNYDYYEFGDYTTRLKKLF